MIHTLITRIHEIQDFKWIKILSEYAFCLAVLIEVLIVLIDKSQLMNPIEGRLFQITFALCLIKVIFTKYEVEEYITIFLFCLLGLAVDYFGGRNEIIRAFMFVASFKGVNLKKCLKYVFWTTLAGCLIIALLSLMGLLGNLTVPKLYNDETLVHRYWVSRYCFGMGNPNSFHIMLFAILILGMYIYQGILKFWVYPLLLIFDVFLFYLARCKTAFIMMTFAIVAFAVYKYASEKVKKVLDWLCLFGGVFSVGISVWFGWIGKRVYAVYWKEPSRENTFLFKLDQALTGRLLSLVENENWDGAMESWKWFTVREHEKYLDLGFVRLFFWYGIIPATVILISFLALYVFLLRKKEHEELLFLTLIAIFTIVEAHFVSVYIGRCYPLFILGAYWPRLVPWRKEREEQLV